MPILSSLFFSASPNDGVTFNPQHVLFQNVSAQDRYIVALGFVTKGTQLLGALYGAGPVESLDQNQIFARWLQKKVLITDSCKRAVFAPRRLRSRSSVVPGAAIGLRRGKTNCLC